MGDTPIPANGSASQINDKDASRSSSTKTFRSVREMKTNQSSGTFSHYDNKYKCCCGSVHVKQGTIMIAYLTIALSIFHLITLVISPQNNVLFYASIAAIVVQIICSCLVLWGIRKNKAALLLPNIIMLAASVVACIVGLIIFAWAAFDPDSYGAKYIKTIVEAEQDEQQRAHSEKFGHMMMTMVAIFMVVICLFSALITAWWTHVHVGCYKYLRDVAVSRDVKHKEYVATVEKV